jgi:hypothetical protein
MTTPSGTIAVSDVNAEIGRTTTATTDLNFLNGYVKPAIRPGSPNLGSDRGLTYYQQNNAGNCNNSNVNNCNCNCGNINCTAGANCTAINCANCDSQKWLQTGNCNVSPTPVYNCTSNQNCYSYNCNCNCACSKIICTKLFQLGLMCKRIFEADQAFGARMIETNTDIYNGYRAWAEIWVDWMDGKGPKMMPWMSDDEHAVAIKNWSTSWAYDIATPWAEEMAYIMGAKETGSLTGKLIMGFGVPICKVVGVWQRWFGQSKKEAGFFSGAFLITISIMFKLVVNVGRFIEKFIPQKRVV